MNTKRLVSGAIGLTLFAFSAFAAAHDGGRDFNNSDNCQVGTVFTDAGGNPLSIDEKFGAGSKDVTRCLRNTKRPKVLYQINTECKNSKCDAPYAIGNIMNHIRDYEITHGMSSDDYEIVVIVHSAGWKLILDNNAMVKHSADNPFQAAMESLLMKPSVKVLFCQNTANSKSVVKANMLDKVGFVTAGVSAITDLQDSGYRYVQP